MDEAASALLAYAKSAEADGVIAKSGFIDLGVKTQDMTMGSSRAQSLLTADADPYEGAIMREMLGEMVAHDRLSTTFRFRTGSSRLDERARIDMARLVDFLELQPAGTRIKFVGFTDSVGAFDSNRELSVKRANQVMEAVDDFAGDRLEHVDMSSTGFGEIAPSACNTDDRGRSINRRVEVWIEGPVQG